MRVSLGIIALLVVMIGARASAQSEIGISVAARVLQPGELLVMTLSFATEPSSVRVTAFGKEIPAFAVADGTWHALVGIDIDQPPGTYVATAEALLASATVRGAHTLIVESKNFPTRTLRVAPDFVNPPPSLWARIERELRLVSDAFANSAPERLWQAPFTRPVPDPANSRFGARSVFNGEPRSPHSGTDFVSAAGTPVQAPNSGRIVVAQDLFFTGKTVIIDHGLGLVSTLAHLSRIDVEEGATVTTGQTVGLVGATGRVTGAHLHWGVRVSHARVDPLSVLALIGEPAANAPAAPR